MIEYKINYGGFYFKNIFDTNWEVDRKKKLKNY